MVVKAEAHGLLSVAKKSVYIAQPRSEVAEVSWSESLQESKKVRCRCMGCPLGPSHRRHLHPGIVQGSACQISTLHREHEVNPDIGIYYYKEDFQHKDLQFIIASRI